MKSIITLLTIVACSYAAQLNRAYLPPEHAQSSSGSELLETPIAQPIIVSDDAVYHKSSAELNTLNSHHQQAANGFVQIGSIGNSFAHGAEVVEHVNYHGHNLKVHEHRPERPQAAVERDAAILRQDYKNDGNAYAYVYETENGIFGEENGVATHGVAAHGAYSYTGDDGVQYSITYTADENGFQPHGDHLPTPPPIPEEILKSLEQNARDEAAGIFDDGSYHEETHGEKVAYVTNDAHYENEAHAVVINEHEHDAAAHVEEDAVVTKTVLIPEPGLQRPVFRNPALEHQVVVNIPGHVITDNAGKGYLPPIQHPVVEDESSQHGKIVFGTRNRQPSFNSKKGYHY